MTKRKALTLDRAVDRFLTDLDLGGATPRTLDSYARILHWTIERLGTDADPFALEKDDILDVLSHWKKRGAGSSTIANRVSCLRTFFSWLADEYPADVDENPMERIKRPRKDRPITRSLSSDEITRLMLAATSKRDRLVVSMYAMTALRRSELISLRWRDVDLERREIRVLGKGRKGRTVPLHPLLASLLLDARAEASERGWADPEHYVCCRRREFQLGRSEVRDVRTDPVQPMGYSTPEKIIKRLARSARLEAPDSVSPHTLRRGFSTLFLHTNPGDLFRLQQILGHADISTTRAYLRDAEIPEIRDALDRLDFGPAWAANASSIRDSRRTEILRPGGEEE